MSTMHSVLFIIMIMHSPHWKIISYVQSASAINTIQKLVLTVRILMLMFHKLIKCLFSFLVNISSRRQLTINFGAV